MFVPTNLLCSSSSVSPAVALQILLDTAADINWRVGKGVLVGKGGKGVEVGQQVVHDKVEQPSSN